MYKVGKVVLVVFSSSYSSLINYATTYSLAAQISARQEY